MGEDVDESAVDASVAGNETVAGDDVRLHVEVVTGMRYEAVEFLEAAFVEQQVDAFAGGEFAGFVLALDALGATAGLGRGIAFFEFREFLFESHARPSLGVEEPSVAELPGEYGSGFGSWSAGLFCPFGGDLAGFAKALGQGGTEQAEADQADSFGRIAAHGSGVEEESVKGGGPPTYLSINRAQPAGFSAWSCCSE